MKSQAGPIKNRELAPFLGIFNLFALRYLFLGHCHFSSNFRIASFSVGSIVPEDL